jgi:hypothetical protein
MYERTNFMFSPLKKIQLNWQGCNHNSVTKLSSLNSAVLTAEPSSKIFKKATYVPNFSGEITLLLTLALWDASDPGLGGNNDSPCPLLLSIQGKHYGVVGRIEILVEERRPSA